MLRIAIIDDSPIIQERLAHRLHGIDGIGTIDQARSRAEAKALLDTTVPDIAILDLQLPDGSGIDILKNIIDENKNIISIVLTNFPYSVLRKQCMDSGADYFFDKSTEFHEVINVVEMVTQKRTRAPYIK